MRASFIAYSNTMTVKVLCTAVGQQIIADTKQIENKETNEIVGYWLSQPRLVQYTRDDDGNLGVNFGLYCLVSDEAEFSLRGDHVVAILEPRNDVLEAWNKLVYPEPIADKGLGDSPADPVEEPVAEVVEAPVEEVAAA